MTDNPYILHPFVPNTEMFFKNLNLLIKMHMN